MIKFFELWDTIIPPFMLENVLSQFIFPKLSQAVENWNPKQDTIPIHAWIHPWLPYFGTKLEPLYAPIRYKLSNVLIEWHPSDPSAHAVLLPWREVFDRTNMDTLITRSIVPKLALVLREFVINPQEQYLDPFKWVMNWIDLVPVIHMTNIFDVEFFSKWFKVLYAWLSNKPNYDEITRWYLGWKSMFSPRNTGTNDNY